MTNPPSDPLAERRAVLARQIESIQTDLKSVTSGDRARFPERYFVGIFLPYFAGDAQPAYPQADMGMWISRVAGSPFAEVDIVNEQGEVIYVIPPMLDRAALDSRPAGDRSVPLEHVIKTAEQLHRMSPLQGENYITQKLTEHALVMRAPSNVLRNLETWNRIFQANGRPVLVPLEDSPAAAAGPVIDPQAALMSGDIELL